MAKKVEDKEKELEQCHCAEHEHHEHEHEHKQHEESCHCHDEECDEDDDDDEDEGCGCHHHEHHHHHGESEHEHGHHHHHCACEGGDDDDEEEEGSSLPKIIISAVLFVIGMLIEKLPFFAPEGPFVNGSSTMELIVKAVGLACFAAAYLICGLGVLKEAIENLIHGEFFGEEFLMSVATVGALCMGEYSEAVAVMVLFQLGEFLEGFAVGKSRKSIKSLMDIRPDKANVKRDGQTMEVMAEDVKVGDIIVVRPGERIPLDGKIISGKSLVDTSALTGESVPREVAEGDEALSGFVNTSGILEIEVTKEFGESTVSRVLEMVQNAQSKKAKAQKFITRFAKVYTPIVCILAVAVAVVPSTIIGGGWPTLKIWIYRALELLVVSCPCALVISVPLSFFAGLGLASKHGILIKGSNYIEKLSKANTVAFDKTGTLTKGVFEVTGIHVAKEAGLSEEQLVALAAHAEYYSNHPISKSLKNAHSCEKCAELKGDELEEISGHGVKCVLEGKTVLAGNMRLMEKENVSGLESCQKDDAGTLVHVAVDGKYMGHIVISDVVKDDAAEAISKLHKCGVKKTVMLTGDNEIAAQSTGKALGLDLWFAGLLPQDKVSKIEELLEANEGKNGTVAFVGDGINDAPVLSRSDVGIAMGAMGSDAAIEAADVVIMDDMPSRVADAVKVAKKTMRNVWQNVWFALFVKVAIMVLCTLGVANMWVAVFGDVGVTVLAVLNSMRLMWGAKRK